MPDKPILLCVDDEPEVLAGLRLQLRKEYRVYTATSGDEGLTALAEHPNCAIVISDMRMPGMNGAQFLTLVRERAPEVTRLLLTGQSDIDAAISAINNGQIFRFLNKPCPPDRLRGALADALAQHRLVTGHRILLEKTLNGTVKVLSDVLAISSPSMFSRASAIKRITLKVAKQLGITSLWPLELATIFANLGSISLTDETLNRLHEGQPLNEEEQQQVANITSVSRGLIQPIPHLERVGKIIEQSVPSFEGSREKEGALLALCTEFSDQLRSGERPDSILAALHSHFKADYVKALSTVIADEQQLLERISVSLRDLREGMLLADDLHHSNGSLLIGTGVEVSHALIDRLRSIGDQNIDDQIYVYVAKKSES